MAIRVEITVKNNPEARIFLRPAESSSGHAKDVAIGLRDGGAEELVVSYEDLQAAVNAVQKYDEAATMGTATIKEHTHIHCSDDPHGQADFGVFHDSGMGLTAFHIIDTEIHSLADLLQWAPPGEDADGNPLDVPDAVFICQVVEGAPAIRLYRYSWNHKKWEAAT